MITEVAWIMQTVIHERDSISGTPDSVGGRKRTFFLKVKMLILILLMPPIVLTPAALAYGKAQCHINEINKTGGKFSAYLKK